MGLLNKGLYDPNRPAWAGCGGRFTPHKVQNVWSRHDDVKRDEQQSAPFAVYKEVSDTWADPQTGTRYENDFVPVWRWRRAKTEVTISADAAGKQIHLILHVRDRNPIASLYDYRRVVVDIGGAP